MPDNIALSAEEQSYFDNRGEQPVANEQAPAEEIKQPIEKAPVAKQEKKIGRPRKEAIETESIETEIAEPVIKQKSPEQEEKENLQAALREERRMRTENERRTEERLRLLQQVIETKPQPQVQQQQEVIPDPERDALGALKYLLQQQQRGNQVQQQSVQQQQAVQMQQRIMGEASRMEMDYISQQPDYDANSRQSTTYNEASNFLVNMRKAELMATGAYNPVQINEILSQEAVGLAAQAVQAGRNPAQVVMDIAKARGFRATPKQAVETEQEKITRIAKGQEAGFSLSQASGSKAPTAGSKLDAKTVATMSDDDFTALMAKAKKSDLRSIFGD